MTGSWTLSFCSSVRIQIHGLSGYLILQFQSYSFKIVYVYTHNGGLHVHRNFNFIEYLIMTGSWTQSFFYAPATKSWGDLDFCQIFTKSQVVGLHFLRTIYIMETWFVWLLKGFDLFIISYVQARASFLSYRHTSFLKNHS